MKKYLRLLVVLMAAMIATGAMAQDNSREYIRNTIQRWGQCRNVAITKTNGDVAIYGASGSGYACKDVPASLAKTLGQLRDDDKYIDDVQLTEQGNWLILFGKNSIRYHGIPEDLKETLKKAISEDETITSVTFNDSGDWILISDEYVRSSNDALQEWLSEGMEDLGKVYAACVTDDAVIVVFQEGYKYYGTVPVDLLDALKDTTIEVYRLKVSGGSWFFADMKGKNFRFNM